MGYREEVLLRHGYTVRYEKRLKYRCSPETKLCIAEKDRLTYFAFRVCPPAAATHFQRIHDIQSSIPHMARMVGPIEDVFLLEEARGQLLWDMETPPENLQLVEDRLIEFGQATKKNQLIHGDLRPWNVFCDNEAGVRVIDWSTLSAFVDDLIGESPCRQDLIKGHYANFHPCLVRQSAFLEIDLRDAKLIGKLLRGETALSDPTVWGGQYRALGGFLWQPRQP